MLNMNKPISLVISLLFCSCAVAQQVTPQVVPKEPWQCGLIGDAAIAFGKGYAAGKYDVALAGGTGSGVRAKIAVGPTGSVSDVEITDQGGWYTAGDVLTAALGNSGSGFALTVEGVRDLHPVHRTTTDTRAISKVAGDNPCPHEQIDPAEAAQRTVKKE